MLSLHKQLYRPVHPYEQMLLSTRSRPLIDRICELCEQTKEEIGIVEGVHERR
jgi:hypothetical protein